MRGEHRQTSGYPQDPPGDELVEQVLEGEEKQEALRRAAALPRLMVDREAEITLEMIATGVFSPITGFLPRVENESVLEEGRLTDGTPWPIPLSMLRPAGVIVKCSLVWREERRLPSSTSGVRRWPCWR